MAVITIIGLGNMGFALSEGLLRSGFVSEKELKGIELSEKRASFVSERLNIELFQDYGILEKTDVIILAVKPQNMSELLKEIKPFIKNQLIISVAAGITVKALKEGIGDKKIVRTMPNTPALISKGVTGVYCTDKVTEKEKKVVDRILSAVGDVIFVEKEDDIDKITALSGSGPAYVYYFMEALEEAGVYIGLSRDLSRKLAVATFVESSAMVKETEKSPATLKEMVTSPGGTTITGLYCMDRAAVKGTVIEAVMAAYKRAKELGNK